MLNTKVPRKQKQSPPPDSNENKSYLDNPIQQKLPIENFILLEFMTEWQFVKRSWIPIVLSNVTDASDDTEPEPHSSGNK